jgi:hypothetical protein
VRKSSAFGCSLDGNEAAKTLQRIQEKFCEKNTHLVYRLSEPLRITRKSGSPLNLVQDELGRLPLSTLCQRFA